MECRFVEARSRLRPSHGLVHAGAMKRWAQISTILLLAIVVLECRASDAQTIPDPDADVHETAGAWSAIVDKVRGRLVAATRRDARGATSVRIYLELQNRDPRSLPRTFNFNRDENVAWELRDSEGKPAMPWKDPVPGYSDYFSYGSVISIPADATLRFPLCSAEYDMFQKSGAWVLWQGLLKTPAWILTQGRKGSYFLSATFTCRFQDDIPSRNISFGPLALPAVRLPSDPVPQVWPANGQGTIAPSLEKP